MMLRKFLTNLVTRVCFSACKFDIFKSILGLRICSAMQGPDFDFQTFFVAPGQKAIVLRLVRSPYVVL